MSLAIKHLAGGLIPSGPSTLYTVPDGKSAIVRIILVNIDENASHEINILFKKLDETVRQITPFDLVVGPRYKVDLDIPFSMEAGDSIVSYDDVGNVFDYLINGVLEELIATV